MHNTEGQGVKPHDLMLFLLVVKPTDTPDVKLWQCGRQRWVAVGECSSEKVQRSTCKQSDGV
eukprot:scaffold360330_cov40-Prasinocladus_malaysianus.AAC.1